MKTEKKEELTKISETFILFLEWKERFSGDRQCLSPVTKEGNDRAVRPMGKCMPRKAELRRDEAE